MSRVMRGSPASLPAAHSSPALWPRSNRPRTLIGLRPGFGDPWLRPKANRKISLDSEVVTMACLFS